MSLPTLLALRPDELKPLVQQAGLPPFAAKQVAGWLYGKGVTRIAQMTNLSLAGRERLAALCSVGCSAPVTCMRSSDGTAKYLYRTADGHYIESVFIPDGERATLCVSSQVGCKMGCAFCMTGRQGFSAQLSAADILNQLYSLPERDRITNIVFMGQGEPLDNWDNVARALEVLTAPWGFAMSPRRITVSTVGLHKNFLRLLTEVECHVAISLHNPFPAERAEWMPAERGFSIEQVAEALRQQPFCRRLPAGCGAAREGAHQRRLSFEYIVFGGANDTPRHAARLVSLLRGLDCRINLIRFHTIPDTPFRSAPEATMLRLRDYLTAHGIFTTIRASRGEDILAACGLLSTQQQEAEREA